MNDTRFDIPVLLIIFNRPDTAAKVMEAVKKVKPAKLYIAADGPRADKNGEDLVCEEARNAVLDQIDWECEVYTLFRKENIGCREAPAKAISWLFANEEMGIILEDDCIPDQSFFNYCRELLYKYKDNERVMHISGFNEQDGQIRGEASYYFTYFSCCWGWATWRHAWKHHKLRPENVDMEFRNKLINIPFQGNVKAAEVWLKQMFYNLDSTWDYQWCFAIWKNSGICITPNVSLVRNIGFDERATHTGNKDQYNNVIFGKLTQLRHPVEIYPHNEADKYLISKRYYKPFLKRMYRKLNKALVPKP